MIKTENLTKIYKLGETKVIGTKNVNLSIEDGEFISIMGPSGSGKSTLLNLIGCIDKPTSGRVIIDGIDVAKLNDRSLCDLRREKIGFIFQSFNLLPVLTTIENVIVPLASRGIDDGIRERAAHLLETVGLGKRINHTPHELSGGEQQRVAIARALINNPEIVLADEPTGELDTKSSEETIQLMRSLNRKEGVTIIIITHDPMVSEKAERIVHLQDGKIISDRSA
jgi:putative ABC transport system ATP-binding protein